MAITIKNINQLPTGSITDSSPIMFGIGTDIFTTTFGAIKTALQGDYVTDLSFQMIDDPRTVLESAGNSFLNARDATIAKGELTFLRFKVIDDDGALGINTYIIPLGEGDYSPLFNSINFEDLILVDREVTVIDNSPNTVTYIVADLDEINDSDPGFDFTDTDLIYFVELDGILYRFIGTNGTYGINDLQMQMSDLQLVSDATPITIDSVLNQNSSNPVTNQAITREFIRTNFDGIPLNNTSISGSTQSLLDINYRFLEFNGGTNQSILITNNAPLDFNVEGYAAEQDVIVNAGAGVTLIAPYGQTVSQGNFFRIRNVKGKFFLEISNNGSGGGSGSGDMTKAVYDPQNIEADAFDRENHTGTQDVSTITGLGDLATLNEVGNAEMATMPAETFKLAIVAGQPINATVAQVITLLGLDNLAFEPEVTTALLANNAVTNLKLANMNANTIKGRGTGNGQATDLTPSEVRDVIDVYSTTETNDELATKQNKLTNVTPTITANSYTLQASDVDKILLIQAPCQVVVPNGLAANLQFQGKQLGGNDVDVVEFVAQSGGTLNVTPAFQNKTDNINAYWAINTLGSDEADLFGTLKLSV